MTHHDGITGNNLQLVDDDYKQRLTESTDKGYKAYEADMAELMQKQT